MDVGCAWMIRCTTSKPNLGSAGELGWSFCPASLRSAVAPAPSLSARAAQGPLQGGEKKKKEEG